ncbi:hypothetical protein Hanom_Chr02g00166851 [Helianthus anomalus]
MERVMLFARFLNESLMLAFGPSALTWDIRMKIVVGTAKGYACLLFSLP